MARREISYKDGSPFVKGLRRCSIYVVAALLSFATALRAQVNCDTASVSFETDLVGVASDYGRLAELSGMSLVSPRLARRSSNPMVSLCAVGPWQNGVRYLSSFSRVVRVLPTSLNMSINTAYPEDRNNGALWSGRGMAAALTGGVGFQWRYLAAAVMPVLTFQQNRGYLLLP